MNKHRMAAVIVAGVAAVSLAVVGAGTASAADSDNADNGKDKRHSSSEEDPARAKRPALPAQAPAGGLPAAGALPAAPDLPGLDIVTDTVGGLLGGGL